MYFFNIALFDGCQLRKKIHHHFRKFHSLIFSNHDVHFLKWFNLKHQKTHSNFTILFIDYQTTIFLYVYKKKVIPHPNRYTFDPAPSPRNLKHPPLIPNRFFSYNIFHIFSTHFSPTRERKGSVCVCECGICVALDRRFPVSLRALSLRLRHTRASSSVFFIPIIPHGRLILM